MIGNKAWVLSVVAAVAIFAQVADAVVCCVTCSDVMKKQAKCAQAGYTSMFEDVLPAHTGTIEECAELGFAHYMPEDETCGIKSGYCDPVG